jgi:AcrR family transcriptional regulator
MDRRSEILTTAGHLFRERGYHATSMRDIAASLELRGSSLYAHIDSKEEVLWEIVNHAADAFLAHAEAVEQRALAPREHLRGLVEGHLRVIVQELPRATVFFHEWKFLSPERRAQVVERRDRYEGFFRRAVEAGVASGDFRTEDPKLATLFILSALNWTYQWFREGGRLDLEALTERYMTLIFNALGGCR